MDRTEFTLEVINTNDPPMIINEDVLSVHEGEHYSVQYMAEDIDPSGDVLSWTLLTNCTFLDMHHSTGVLSGTPGESDAGSYSVNVTVTDGNGGYDSHIFDLIVLKVNNPPYPIKDNWRVDINEDEEDRSLNLADMFGDVDGDELQYRFELPDELTVTIFEDLSFSITPVENWHGLSTITVTADDGDLTNFATISVNVISVNDVPYDPVIQMESPEFTENETQTVSASALDLDENDRLTYDWYLEEIGFIGSGETIDLNLTAGTYTLILRVSDRSDSYIETSMEIVVKPKGEMVPHPSEPESETNLVPYLIGGVFLLLIGIFILTIFVVRKRNIRKENTRQGMEAWSSVLSFPEGPTPTKGLAPGPGIMKGKHRYAPDRGPTAHMEDVNGGKLGEIDQVGPEPAEIDMRKEQDYLSELVEDILSSREKIPSNSDLMDRLKKARADGSIPSEDLKEIERKLNNIDK
jgi:hypothetical protein